ncbi:UNVERIFIED_CONTAM: hypothetical protein K2H54_061522 [Gekko kuhli]
MGSSLASFWNPKVYTYNQRSITHQKVTAMQPTSTEGLEDMAALVDLHEGALMHNLFQRYQQDRIYLGDWESRQKLLTLARDAGYILYEGQQVLIFPDIPQEALAIRHRLKATTEKLRSSNIRYRWLQSGHLQVIYQGKAYQAKDEDTGLKMLQALKLQDDTDPRRSQKRKHIPSATPEKITKFPIREDITPEAEDITDDHPNA